MKIYNDIVTLLTATRKVLKNELNSDAYKVIVKDLYTKSRNFPYGNKSKGQIIRVITDIGVHSIAWWELHPDAGYVDSTYKNLGLPAWAATDIARGIIGATSGAISSYLGSGEVSGTSVATGGIIGAVAGSTGAVDKLASMIITLF